MMRIYVNREHNSYYSMIDGEVWQYNRDDDHIMEVTDEFGDGEDPDCIEDDYNEFILGLILISNRSRAAQDFERAYRGYFSVIEEFTDQSG